MSTSLQQTQRTLAQLSVVLVVRAAPGSCSPQRRGQRSRAPGGGRCSGCRGDRARRAHRRPAADPGGRRRRTRAPDRELQRNAQRPGRIAGTAAAAGRRRRTRAAHPAHLVAHQPGTADGLGPAERTGTLRAGPRGDVRRRPGPGDRAVRAGRRPRRAGQGGHPASGARTGGPHRRRGAGAEPGKAPGAAHRVRRPP